ncbi:MAG: hypothetical protein JWQ71_2403 [Pedosphaera sp.]|nr:hypothetical protein [Pedosphaera sp.]
MKRVFIVIISISLCISILFLSGCSTELGAWRYQEISRTKSPDSTVDAVPITGDSGATSSTAYILVIVPSGRKIDVNHLEKLDELFTTDHVKHLRIVWKQAQLVGIHYDEARISKFKNFWSSKAVQDYRYVVELRLEPGNSQNSLPFGDRFW